MNLTYFTLIFVSVVSAYHLLAVEATNVLTSATLQCCLTDNFNFFSNNNLQATNVQKMIEYLILRFTFSPYEPILQNFL